MLSGTQMDSKVTPMYMVLGNLLTIFQAEMLAIYQCGTEIKATNLTQKQISIMSNYQAAIKALDSIEIKYKIVWYCLKNVLPMHYTKNYSQFCLGVELSRDCMKRKSR